jgi:hypothetical protein
VQRLIPEDGTESLARNVGNWLPIWASNIPEAQDHTGRGFSPGDSFFPCQYHSTNAPYSFIPLPPTLYSVFLPVLQFSLSVSFHNCSILIHDWLYIILAVDLLNNTRWKKLNKYLRNCIKIPPNSVVK